MALGDDGGPELQAVPTFDALFVAEYSKMVALAGAVSGSRAHAEDIAQEAMSRLSENWTKVQGFDKPGAWVRRVTINLALSRKRKLVSEAKALMRIGAPEATIPPLPVEDAGVWAAVAGLPKQQRAVVALHFLEDRTFNEIADILEISPSTARVHLHQARQSLHDRLQQEDVR